MEESLARCRKLFPIVVLLFLASLSVTFAHISGSAMQPLSKITIQKAPLAMRESVSIKASPHVLGLKGEDTEWETVNLVTQILPRMIGSWVGFFSRKLQVKYSSSILQLVCQIMRKKVHVHIPLPATIRFHTYAQPRSRCVKLEIKANIKLADLSFRMPGYDPGNVPRLIHLELECYLG
ncbi:putative inactive purple acid phosphatase 24 [Morella rubra]|uniref:Putative inactive purple acid phosphatase 24 n=1 Tax=Morella rubra TaxID=262757 RepID=A0A6A1W0V7_9ROSI|nr:putative inactive purple acid phosphatase 24 [Morella rubra]